MRNHFQYPGHRKKRHLRSRLGDDLSRRIMRPWEHIICILNVLKNDFGEVDEAKFQGVERPRDIIFCIFGIEKSDLNEVA
jgi:hypothetical protein